MTPKVHLVAYQDRQNNFIFVAIPNERGRYLRTDRSVALAGCPLCKAMIGEPCHDGRGRYNATTHYDRRKKVRWSTQGWTGCDDIHPSMETTPDEVMEAAA